MNDKYFLCEAQIKGLPPLLHISFRKLPSILKPQLPAGSNTKKSKYSEPEVPRVSFSPTIEKCFQAIYPNVSKYFEEENYPYMTFYVYQAQLTSSNDVMTPQELIQKRWVHDAHMTEEHIVLNPVRIKLIGKWDVLNTSKSPDLMYRPFNDPKEPMKYLAPKQIKIKKSSR
jgi:hypothetical protein